MSRRRSRQALQSRRLWFVAFVVGGAMALLAVVSGMAFGASSQQPYLPAGDSVRRAAIVDQVALTFPNTEFQARASEYLEQGGYKVDVFKGEEVGVEFYRTLPTKGYGLILVRSHATNLYMGMPGGPDALFTSQPYRKDQYVVEQITDQIGSARMVYGNDSSRYFSIMANFVEHSMIGRFDRTLIILGGCQTMGTRDLGRALLARGASAVVGWNEMVTLSHNDTALLRLLHNFVLERQPLQLAVQNAMAFLGPDPVYKSSLIVIP